MTDHLLQAAGGLGLFLLGMLVLTEGLHGLVGESLARSLRRFTRTPWSGAASGAAATAVLQSSSLTTVTVVGFVSAGLMSFPEALGVLFGANLGTTITGWLVALLGLELGLEAVVLPVLLLGVLLKLFGRPQTAHAGWALAGFALVFLGLARLKAGMEGFEGSVTPSTFPPDTWPGRLQLVGIGVVLTLVTQSSSAGVAMALTALATGTIQFPQAAALVIGMDVGTTSSALLATLGGSTASRRTGWSHVVYNLLTGAMALALLDPYARGLEAVLPGAARSAPTYALVGFHTFFNGLGVLLVLPFTGAFARLMAWIVPEPGPDLAGALDRRLLREPGAASRALLTTVRRLAVELLSLLAARLEGNLEEEEVRERLAGVDQALRSTREYADEVGAASLSGEARERHLTAIHALDHLVRLAQRCRGAEAAATVRGDARLRELSASLCAALREAAAGLAVPEPGPGEAALKAARDAVRARREPYREEVLEESMRGGSRVELSFRRMDAIRWLHRSTYHAWRIVHHLQPAAPGEGPPDPGEA